MRMFKFFKGPGGGFAPALVGKKGDGCFLSYWTCSIGLLSHKFPFFSDSFALNVNCWCNFH